MSPNSPLPEFGLPRTHKSEKSEVGQWQGVPTHSVAARHPF